MFFGQKQPTPTPPTPELDSLEFNLRLSGPTIVKLLSIAVAILCGSGVLVHTTSNIIPLDAPSPKVQTTP
ncbi:hypothetical protein Lepto7375DRAFT_6803 [Leptolyngbya sp. PCC 7375]|nr:hypothetical protein Lepto7375DRAFT_6803 [Leptolyngbya sp. PCC 7375]